MSWDEEAATWDDHAAVRAYAAAAFSSLQSALSDRGKGLKNARVFDFGCGTGLLTAAMAATADRVVGLDLSAPMVDRLVAKALPNVMAVCGTLEEQMGEEPLLPGGFDVVTCSSVCAFVDDYPATVARLATLLAPGGIYLQWDWELDPTADEPMGLTREAIQQALADAGLLDVTVGVGFETPVEDAVMAPLLGTGVRW